MNDTKNKMTDEQIKRVEWEIVLSGDHADICVFVTAPENATDAELQSLAEIEALRKTYIWSKRKL